MESKLGDDEDSFCMNQKEISEVISKTEELYRQPDHNICLTSDLQGLEIETMALKMFVLRQFHDKINFQNKYWVLTTYTIR